MKLRIKGNSIRLRLTKTEVEQFGRDGQVQESVQFGPDHFFHYQIITLPDSKALKVSYEDHTIRIAVPAGLASEWVNTDRVGFEQEVKARHDHIHLLVEKDFQCLHRENDGEPDNYVHPLAQENTGR